MRTLEKPRKANIFVRLYRHLRLTFGPKVESFREYTARKWGNK